MRRKDALFVAICVAIIAFAFAFVWPLLEPTRVAWYSPLEHRWSYEVSASALAMDFFGRLAFATAIACGAFAAGYAVSVRLGALGSQASVLLVAWAGTAVAFALVCYAWTLQIRTLTPPPLPSWYQPR